MKGEKASKTVEKAIIYYILWESPACYKFIFHVNGLKKKIKLSAVIVIHLNIKGISFFEFPLMLMSRKINLTFSFLH